MGKLFDKFLLGVKQEFNYTNTQIAQIRYVFLSILSEVSKLIMIGLFFALNGKFFEFALCAFILVLIRTNSGGLHFNHYTSCLIFSFLFFYMAIMVLPHVFHINKSAQVFALLVCIVINYCIEPIRSIYRPKPDEDMISRCHFETFKYIFLYLIIVFVLPQNSYLYCGFWIIILQIIQLIFANIMKERGESNEEVF